MSYIYVCLLESAQDLIFRSDTQMGACLWMRYCTSPQMIYSMLLLSPVHEGGAILD